jgi:hypothetical protein
MTIAQVARLTITWSTAGTRLASQAGGKAVHTNKWNTGAAAAVAASARQAQPTAPPTVASGVIVSAKVTQAS